MQTLIWNKVIFFFLFGLRTGGHQQVQVQQRESILGPDDFLAFRRHKVANKFGPVEEILGKDIVSAVVTHHKVETSEEFLEFGLLVEFLVCLVETVSVPQDVLDFGDEVLSPLHVQGLMLFFVKVSLQSFKGSLVKRVPNRGAVSGGSVWC